MTKQEQIEIEEMLSKLKRGEFCLPECYGCCGDGYMDITCNIVVDNFVKELHNAGYMRLRENVILLDNDCCTVIAAKSLEDIKSEYASDMQKAFKEGYDKGYNDGFEDARSAVRKETAKEFAKKVKQKYAQSCSEYYPELIVLTSEQLDELLKEYEK